MTVAEKKKGLNGSDHCFHLNLISSIKNSGHKFAKDNTYIKLGQKNFFDPQLYHWILSFLPEKVYKEKFKYIGIVIKLIEIIAFNIFLFFLYNRLQFKEIIFLYANIIVNIFPFTYALWNAKNIGLSSRGIGLVAGHIYTYLIIGYVLTGNLFLLFALFAIIFIIILINLMAIQYVLLSIPFFVLFFNIPEIIPIPFLSLGFFYLIMPQVAKNYIIGQFNHKRNYALFFADIFILRARPGIYRDFVYDFWIKLKKNFITGLAYVYLNPIVEIIYGLPFLWFVLYAGMQNELNQEMETMFHIILSALAIFFLTSFRWTRFLGEPQRYLEFVIPLITIVYVLNFDIIYHIALVSFSLFILMITRIIQKGQKGQANPQIREKNRALLIDYLESEGRFKNSICVSNDRELLKYLSLVEIKPLPPDISIFYKDKEDCYRYFNGNFNELSFYTVSKHIDEFKPNLLILNCKYYSFNTLQSNIHLRNFSHIIDLNEYSVYEINN